MSDLPGHHPQPATTHRPFSSSAATSTDAPLLLSLGWLAQRARTEVGTTWGPAPRALVPTPTSDLEVSDKQAVAETEAGRGGRAV